MHRKGGVHRGEKGDCGRGYSYRRKAVVRAEAASPAPVSQPRPEPCKNCGRTATPGEDCPSCGYYCLPF
jgi:ribosomal protein L32